MKILIACEESQEVCKAFRAKGHEAYSCDIMPCSGGHPEWHLQQDVIPLLKEEWDMIIAFPPCIYLSNVATRFYSLRVTPAEKVVKRWEERAKAVAFFMMFLSADCPHIAIENPIGFMSTAYRKPDQIISPWQFAESESDEENYVSKKTCLWLKNLPKLKPLGKCLSFDNEKVYGKYSNGKTEHGKIHRKEHQKIDLKLFRASQELWLSSGVI